MSTSQFHPSDRGAVYRAPTMRIYHSKVVTSHAGPSWLRAYRMGSWRPVKLSWATNGELTTLKLKRQLGLAPTHLTAERAEDVNVVDGDIIRMVQVDNGSARVRKGKIEWFRGYVARRQTVIEPEREDLIITAYGPEIRLQGKVVSGQWHKNAAADDLEIQGNLSSSQANRDNAFRSDLPVIFNESGKPNASQSNWRLTAGSQSPATNDCKVFEAPGRKVHSGLVSMEAKYWTAYTALRSLVACFDNDEVISPHTPWKQIKSLLGLTPIGEVRVEGMNLLEAIKAILLPLGFGFAIEPWTVGNGSDQWGMARHRLIVFSLRDPAIVKSPRLAPVRSGNVAINSSKGQKVEVQRLDFLRDSHGIANDITVIGDPKRKQIVLEFNNNASTRDLHPLWNTTTHSLVNWASSDIVDPWKWLASGDYTFENFAKKYNRDGKDHRLDRHVFRSFAWNEDGAFSSLISTRPDLSDFGLGDQGNYVRRPRPIASMFTYDSAGEKVRLLPRKVQLGIVGDDDSWIDISAEIWNDRAGFTISLPLLAGNTGDGQWYPYAPYKQYSGDYRNLHYLTLLHNALRNAGDYKLRLRLIGSAECDQSVKGVAPHRQVSAWPFRAQKVLRLGGRFKWRKIEETPFAGDANYSSVDDSAEAEAYAQRLRDVAEDCNGRGSLLLRYLTRSYCPGDGIAATSERVVDLHVDGGQRQYAPLVVGVTWDFDKGANKTELLLDRTALKVT